MLAGPWLGGETCLTPLCSHSSVADTLRCAMPGRPSLQGRKIHLALRGENPLFIFQCVCEEEYTLC